MGRTRLRAKRVELGLSQEEMAARLEVDRSTYARWERGEVTDLRPRHRRRLAELCGVRVVDVDELLVEDGRPAEKHADSVVEQLRVDVAHLVDLDGRYGGDDVLPLATHLFRTSQRRLAASSGREIQAAVAEAGEVAGWVAYDADQLDVARSLSLEALHLARLAGDRSMVLFVFANLAMIDLQQKQPGEALSITDHVLDGRPAGRVGGLFKVREARGLAQRGEHRRALDAIEQAQALLDEGVAAADPSWAWWFDAAELAWHHATVHAEMGNWDKAVPAYRDAYDSRSAMRSTAAAGQRRPVDRRHRGDFNDLVHLVDGLAAIEEWREVEDLMPEVLGYVGEIRSSRTTRLLGRIIKRASRSGTVTSTVEDQVEQLARHQS